MANTQEIYRKKTKESSKLFAKAKKVHINGVHHNIRFFEPYPFITKSAEGKFLKDVDELSLSTGKPININLIKKVLNQ